MSAEIPQPDPTLVALKNAWVDIDKYSFLMYGLSGIGLFKAESGEQTLVVVASQKYNFNEVLFNMHWPYGSTQPPIRVVRYTPETREPILDSEDESFLNENSLAGSVGFLHNIVDFADPEYVRLREEVKEWYSQKNFPEILSRLEAISQEDYLRWVATPKTEITSDGITDKRMKARYSTLEKVGDQEFRQIFSYIKNNLAGPQGHPHEDFILNLAAGKYKEILSTEAMRNALKVLDGGGIDRSFVFEFAIIAETLCAPPDFYEQVMANTVKGQDNFRSQTILVCETVRLLLIQELKRRLP